MLLRSRAKFYLYSDKSVYSFNVIELQERVKNGLCKNDNQGQ